MWYSLHSKSESAFKKQGQRKNKVQQIEKNRVPYVGDRQISMVSEWETKWLAIYVSDARYQGQFSVCPKRNPKTKLETGKTKKLATRKYHELMPKLYKYFKVWKSLTW